MHGLGVLPVFFMFLPHTSLFWAPDVRRGLAQKPRWNRSRRKWLSTHIRGDLDLGPNKVDLAILDLAGHKIPPPPGFHAFFQEETIVSSAYFELQFG